MNQTIFSNDSLNIFSNSEGIFIEVSMKGVTLDQISDILKNHPEVEISDFLSLKNAIMHAPSPAKKIGKFKDRIVIETVENDMKAVVIYNLSKDDLEFSKRDVLIKDTHIKLVEKGIHYGIKNDFFYGEIENGKTYLIAEGFLPVPGKDCIIKMFELREPKPEITEDGKVNFYELKLINTVKAGEWLGERIDATEGMPGKTVRGIEISTTKGKNIPLVYDKNSIEEVPENGKTVLYSKINGAVNIDNGKITVSNHLDIDGDVDLSTGNIDFDGYVTIKGTVSDGFSVKATKDIEISGPLGIGNVRSIRSEGGSIYIKGGICSKGSTEIFAAKNFFTKFVDNATILCRGLAHIGFYCFNTTLSAKEIVLDASNAQIKGGQIRAEIRITAPIVGSEIEKRTILEVLGFDRDLLKEETEITVNKILELKNEQLLTKQKISYLENQNELNTFQRKEYRFLSQRFMQIREEIKLHEEKRKDLVSYLKTKGNGEINITKRVYPNCLLIIKKIPVEITKVTMATCYYVVDGELKKTS